MLIYARVDPIIDPLLLREQAGFRHRRLTVDQVTLLTQDIEPDSFSAKKKAGAVFVELTAAYDTVWHCGLTCKLLQLLPDRHMVHTIMEMVNNRSFNLTTGNSKRSRLRCLKNGVPQGSVLVPLNSLQHPHLWPANHRLQKACVCWRPKNHACWWRLADSGKGSDQGHDNCRWIPPDLEVKAQHYKNGVGSLPPQQQGS